MWLLSSALVVVIAVALTWQAATHLLRHEVRVDAADWVRALERNTGDLDQLLTTGAGSPYGPTTLPSLHDGDAVIFYRLFDREGNAVYQSEMSDSSLPVAIPAENVRGDRNERRASRSVTPTVRIAGVDDSSPSAPLIYGRIVLPVRTESGAEGTVELYLDQTAKAEHYRESFVSFVTGLALLILFAMSVPMTMVWRKAKQRELAERRLHDMAHTDPLTRLANRSAFRERLRQVLENAKAGPGQMTALFWLDLDRFKTINDALGHPVGDALLCQVAARLKQNPQAWDTVARLGGDEFALLPVRCRSEEQAARLAERLIESLAIPFDVEGHHVVIGVSIGIVFAPRDGHCVDDLLTKADIALYRAKDAGRSTFRYFRPDMEARSQVRHSLEEDLRLAISNSSLCLHYQPQVSLKTAQIVGFEALLRWHHPRYGRMPPHEVVALAEETGLIVPLGFWALKQAAMDATTWPDHVSVSVNISAMQFRHTNLVDLVREVLDVSGLPPDRLDLEITESVVMEDRRATIAKLRRLRQLGLHLAMDDFGTGYSSLNRLRHLPFDRLKVDRSFVRELGGNREDAAIVHAIVTLGKSLGMQIIAEGVETDAQLAQLNMESCDIAQGYFFGRPVPASEIGWQLGHFNPDASVGLHAACLADRPTRAANGADKPETVSTTYQEALG